MLLEEKKLQKVSHKEGVNVLNEQTRKRVSAAIVDKCIARDEINALHMDKSASYAISTTTLPVSANLEWPRFIL